MLRRRTVLALMIVGVVPSFALVNAFVSSARNRRDAIAADWARRGNAELAEGRPAAAADAFRTAGAYARDRGADRLPLALALVCCVPGVLDSLCIAMVEVALTQPSRASLLHRRAVPSQAKIRSGPTLLSSPSAEA